MAVPGPTRPVWAVVTAATAPVLLAAVVLAVTLPVTEHPTASTWITLGAAVAVALLVASLLAWWVVRVGARSRAPLQARLQRSEQLRADAAARLGAALSGTHDLDRILTVTLEAAMAAVDASAGAVFLMLSSGDFLHLAVGRGLDDRVPAATKASGTVSASWPGPAQPMPAGVVSRVAGTGERLLGTVGAARLALADDEPRAGVVLALPLRSAGQVTGVVALYDPEPSSDAGPGAGSEPPVAEFTDADADAVAGFLATAELAIDNVLLHQETQRLSITDGLTGLWNYRYATLALTREVERASRFRRPLAVLMLDLDRFKRVNDMFGHQRGDAVLAEVASRVRTVVRDIDILARYGGEELVLMLPETDEPGAVLLAGRVMDAIRGQPMGAPGEQPLRMTSSIGIALHPQHGDNPRALLRAADSALYAAKAAGRDRCLLADGVGEAGEAEAGGWAASAVEPTGRTVIELNADPPRSVVELGWLQESGEGRRPAPEDQA